ncbi:MAG TPA: TadA family conjugal transfer-associated ATPase [Intrasporangiaceae bacterium]|nr:TadA family conjugal transfer-associated ATPase [Intrasporangiaceae bacterium]
MERLLRSLVADPRVTDILINGDGTIWVDRGAELERLTDRIPDAAAVRRLAVRLAADARRRLDDAMPYADGQLSSGIRLHAVLAPVATDGAHISLRVPRRTAFTLEDLIDSGSVSDEQGARLRDLIASRRTVLVSGGTGTGKTTVLGALLGLVPSGERLVVVEDVTELHVEHPHVVRLQARHRNVEGAGEVTMTDLVRQAMRMRPDRLIVGEVRGAEVIDLFRAFNTGHEGGCATIHANSAHDVMTRLEALGALAGLPAEAVRSQAMAAIDAVVHVHRVDGRRQVQEIVSWPPQRSGLSMMVREVVPR